MNRRFAQSLTIVAGAHAVVLIVFLAISGCGRLFERKADVAVPIDFVFEVPREVIPDVAVALPPPPLPPPDPPPAMVPVKQEPRKPIEVSTTKIRREHESPPGKKPLTAEEIAKLLREGWKPGDHTTTLDEDTQCFALIRRAMHAAWVQPSAEEAAGAVAEVGIRLGPGGRIEGWDLARPSGNPVVDASVAQALKRLKRIEGLSDAFLVRHAAVTVSFEVES